jgi:hypothetical protein
MLEKLKNIKFSKSKENVSANKEEQATQQILKIKIIKLNQYLKTFFNLKLVS